MAAARGLIAHPDDTTLLLEQARAHIARGQGFYAIEPARKAAAAPELPQAVDPMQWWGALSKQFTELATTAMKDSATDAAKNLAGSMVKQSFDAAGDTLRKAAAMPGAMVGSVAQAAKAVKTAKAPAKRAPRRKT